MRRAADAEDSGEAPAVGDRAAAAGQLDAGRAALDAGAVEPGVACLRHACAEARAAGDPALLTRALSALGIALVHAMRGRDEEGAALLHEALGLADEAGDRESAAKICRELGFVEVQAGRGASAGRWLLRASRLADAPTERAAVLGVRGMALSDRAHYEPAMTLLRESVATARGCGDLRRAAWSQSILGRALLLRGELDEATEVVDGTLALVEQDGWVAFQPFPEALRAELALRAGDPEHAIALLDHAYALGCRLGDPCWEAMAARARGLVHEAAGERAAALASPARRGRARRAPGRPLRVDPRPLPRRARRRGDRRRGARCGRPRRPCSSASPRAATCASSSCARRCTARGSATRAGSSRRGSSPRASTTPRCMPRSPPRRDHTGRHTAP